MLGLVCRLFMVVRAPYSVIAKVPGEAIFEASAPAKTLSSQVVSASVFISVLSISRKLSNLRYATKCSFSHHIAHYSAETWMGWWIYAMVMKYL